MNENDAPPPPPRATAKAEAEQHIAESFEQWAAAAMDQYEKAGFTPHVSASHLAGLTAVCAASTLRLIGITRPDFLTLMGNVFDSVETKVGPK